MTKNKYGGINDMPVGWTREPQNRRVYRLWFDILRRCYDDSQWSRKKGRSYKDCSVCERWFSLSKFNSDIQKISGYSEWKSNRKMSIDKDLFSFGTKQYSPQTCCFVPLSVNILEKNRRNPTIQAASKARRASYILSKEQERLIFNSEKEACKRLGVRQCSVASCYRKGYKCKGYSIERIGAKMDLEAQHE